MLSDVLLHSFHFNPFPVFYFAWIWVWFSVKAPDEHVVELVFGEEGLERLKEAATGGENVFSTEVEAVIYQHPRVQEVAVIGVPDERYGEALLAVIVPAPGGTLRDEEVIAHCREKIGGYKIPRKFAFVDELPKSAMGKILKTELRRMYAGGSKGSA